MIIIVKDIYLYHNKDHLCSKEMRQLPEIRIGLGFCWLLIGFNGLRETGLLVNAVANIIKKPSKSKCFL
jgi:hypothetical protein